MARHRRGQAESTHDLGFGAKVVSRSTGRLLNRDGTFNVERTGLSRFRSTNVYHALMTMRWPGFMAVVGLAYLVANMGFAAAYLLSGPDALQGMTASIVPGRYLHAFFFSVQTFTSVGYGHIAPHGIAANIIVTVELFTGLLCFALATGLLYARFSLPAAHIIYSRQAVVAPYGEGTGLMFRIINERTAQLLELTVKVVYSRTTTAEASSQRAFDELRLERESASFFPLHMTVVHPIDRHSPLYQRTDADLHAFQTEFYVLITAFDEATSQTVQSRTSYRYDEVIWGAQFKNMLGSGRGGRVSINFRNFHATEDASNGEQ